MQWKIKDILDDGLEVRAPMPAELAEDALRPSGADLEASSLQVELQLFRQSDEVLVRGRIHGDVEVPCGMCLTPAKIEIEAPVELLYAPPGQTPELDDDDPLSEMDVLHHDNAVVNVDEALRDLVIVSMPMAPRCSDSCKGLCVECGHNLNEGPCAHVQPKVVSDAPLRAESKLAEQLRAMGIAGQNQKQKN